MEGYTNYKQSEELTITHIIDFIANFNIINRHNEVEILMSSSIATIENPYETKVSLAIKKYVGDKSYGRYIVINKDNDLEFIKGLNLLLEKYYKDELVYITEGSFFDTEIKLN